MPPAQTTKEKILELLKAGATQRQVAAKLKLSESTVSYHVSTMKRQGFKVKRAFVNLFEVDSNFELHPASKSPIYKDQAQPSPSQPANPSPKLRLHRFKRSYELLEQGQHAEGHINKTIYLNNNEQKVWEFEGLTLRLTTRHLVVEGLELYSDMGILAPQLLLCAEQQADGVASRAARAYGLSLKPEQVQTSLLEIGITEQKEVIKKAKTKGIIPLYWNAEMGKVEVWGDMSHNIGEIESNRVSHAETLRQVFKPILEKRWNTEDQLRINQQIMEDIHYIARNMATHIPFMQYLLQTAKGMHPRKPRPQEQGQRRLP